MTLVQLRQFLALARAGSFVRAAALLHLTQPALSRSIRALEDELGQLLFDRVGRRIELTPFGLQTRERAQALLDDANALRQSGGMDPTQREGRLRLGLGSGPGTLLTHALLRRFVADFPRVKVEIFRANTEFLTRMLREREVDALVVDHRSLSPAPDLEVSDIHETPGAFLCRHDHPLARKRAVSFAQLTAFPIASTPLSDGVARELVQRYGESAHPQRLIRASSDEIGHLVGLARETDTVVLAVRAAAPELSVVRVTPALDAHARFCVVTLARRSPTPFLREVRTLLDRVLAAGNRIR